jgi:hypothetical protein
MMAANIMHHNTPGKSIYMQKEYNHAEIVVHVGSVNLIVISFPSTHKNREYSEEGWLKLLSHFSSPADLANELVHVQKLVLATTVVADFQLSMSIEMM